ncbi:MAG: winged helix-turn-helix domain-containing protein [Arenicellales bacterium]|nr:winged helix-turn-helix domain-containing protein [Arenicellales bacterium]
MTDVQKTQFRLDVGDERLWKGNQPVQISNKAFQLLRLFVSNPNRLLTKDHILEGVWRGLCVSEGLVKEYVHDLRTALDDDPKQPRFIETVHGRGYRFLGGVEEGKNTTDTTIPMRSGSHPPSVVVVPFTNLTEDERWVRFCRGLSDDLVTDLARYPDLMVITHDEGLADSGNGSDNSSIRNLDAEYVLNGSVQASDSQVRVNVRLIEAGNGNHIWAERYDRELGEFFDIQSDIVGHVASSVGGFSGQIPHAEALRLGRKPPADLHAYELYLLGYELEDKFEQQSALRGFELVQRAVQLEPDFARAWLVLGWLCWQIVVDNWADDTNSYWELVLEAFTKAAKLDPLDPVILMELAAVRAIDGDEAGTRDAIERALDLGSNQADLLIAASNYVAMLLGDPQRAKQLLDKGLQMIVRMPRWHYLTGTRVSYFAEDFERSVDYAKNGPDFLPTYVFELLSLAQLDRREEVSERLLALQAKHPRFDPDTFMNVLPITAPNARQLVIEGIEKTGLRSA